MTWIQVGRRSAAADLTVTGPGEFVAELPYDRNSAGMLQDARVGQYAVIIGAGADIEGTLTEVDQYGYSLRVDTGRA